MVNKYRSGFEGNVCADLDRRRVEYEYEIETIPYVIPHNYWPDLKLSNGIYIEMKGRLTAADRTKTLAVLAQNPGVDLRFCFQNANNRLYKGSKTTYAEWCDKKKIPWCQGVIPDEWLKEKPRKQRKRRCKK